MDQRLSMLMLGVDDLERCRHFYEVGLGWTPWGTRQSRTSVKFKAGGVVIAMIERKYLAGESRAACGLWLGLYRARSQCGRTRRGSIA